MADLVTPSGRHVTERAVIDGVQRAVIVTDADGRILLWNAHAEALYGWSEREVLGQLILEVLAPATELASNRDDLAVVASGRVMTGDRTVVRRDGAPVRVFTFTRPLLDATGEVVAIVGVSEDVTAVRAKEQQARDVAEQLKRALEAGGLGTWRWDLRSGSMVWDERLEAVYGLSPGGFDGRFDTFLALLHPDDRESMLKTVRNAVEAKSSYRVEHRVMWPDRSVHWLVSAGGITEDATGVVTGTVGCSMDLTERVAQEEELHRLASVALEAAENERLQRERLEFLAAIDEALNVSSTVHEVMVNVIYRAVPRLGDWCSIHVLGDNPVAAPDVEIAHVNPAMVAYARELQDRFPYDPHAKAGVAHVIRTGETLFLPDITDDVIGALDPTDEERAVIAQLALRSAIAVPLVKRGRILGAMQFVMSNSSRRYNDDDVRLARIVAARIAASLENRRLTEQRRLIAETLQRSLLPASLPTIAGIDLAVRYWPVGAATEVGGDFYDVFPMEAAGRWGLVIGDVCGTGPAAAALTGLARHTIRDSAWHDDDPVAVLHSLNRAVHRSATNTFLTAVFAVLDMSGTHPLLTVACGGHPSPIHRSADGTTAIGEPGTLLGVLDPGRFHTRTVGLDEGDVVVFYTDGATDIPAPGGLSDREFAAVVDEAARTGNAEIIAERVHAALDAITPFDRRSDDVALLIVRVGSGSPMG